MKKLVITLFVALASAMAVSAQDIITRRDGQDIKAVIEEVGMDYVKFRYFEEPDGPVIVMEKYDIFRIQYQSGRISRNSMPWISTSSLQSTMHTLPTGRLLR